MSIQQKELPITDINKTSDTKIEFDSNHRIWLHSGIFHNKKIFEIDNGPLALYNLLRSYEIRDKLKSNYFKPLIEEFYNKGWIASSLPYRTIKHKTGWTDYKINKNIKTILKNRWAYLAKYDVGKPEDQNVYLLGKRNYMGGEDEYFIYDSLA